MGKAFEQALKQIIRQAKTFEGYKSIQVIQPNNKDENEYLLLVSFNNATNYQLWEKSPVRKKWSEQLKNFIHKESQIRHQEGVEFWFSASQAPHPLPPTKWKMALLTWLIIYPLILILGDLAKLHLSFMLPFLRILIVSMILVISMTYFLMPNIARVFAFWIYSKKK